MSRSSLLTRREQEVLALVAEGLTNAEIGLRLWISAGTVRRHLENVYAKLEVHTRTAAVRAAYR
jgi:DNA-binding CsgD family transcriptional regulator